MKSAEISVAIAVACHSAVVAVDHLGGDHDGIPQRQHDWRNSSS